MCAAITTAAIGIGMAGYQAYQGNKQQQESSKALQDYQRQDLNGPSPYDDIPINTVGSDIMREENQRTSANTVDAIRNMGVRGSAILPGVIAQNNKANEATRSYLDDQIMQKNYAIAGDKVRTRGMVENREIADLSGIGQEMEVGNQNMWSGIRGIGNSMMFAANNGDFSKGENPVVEPIGGNMKPAGLAPLNYTAPTYSTPDYTKMLSNNYSRL